MKPWLRGERIILRNIARSDGTVTTAIPAITVQDGRDLLAVFIPQGTRFKNNWHVPANQRASSVASIVPSGKRHYQDIECQTPSLRLYLSGFSYSVGIMFDQNGIFTGWYGNLEAPFIRTKLGLDTRDYALDVVADAAGNWRWKDKAEFKRRLELGLDSEAHQARVRAAGRDFIRRLGRSDWPFNASWQTWQAPEDWKPRVLPNDWEADLGTHAGLSVYAES